MITKKHIALGAAAMAITIGFMAVIPAFAETNGQNQPPQGQWHSEGRGMGPRMMGQKGMAPAVVGQVTAVSGSTITLSSRPLGRSASTTAPTTFTINASNAVVMKNNATSSVSSIAVGDTLMVRGTVSGTTVTATMIRDGVGRPPQANGNGPEGDHQDGMNFQGNGQPIIAGNVSSVSGSTLVVTNNGNTNYTVDASTATIHVAGTGTSTISNVSVGDHVIVQGTINGNSVSATSVIDQKAQSDQNQNGNQNHPGFFGEVGSFFKHLFNF